MKVRLFVGLSAVTLVLAALAFGAKSFQATAQDNPAERQPLLPAPGSGEFKYTPIPSPNSPACTTQIVQPSYTPPEPKPVQEPSLAEMIANLKELRKQEEHLTKTIKEKLKAQKKSLNDMEKELNSLGIETSAPPPPPPAVPNSPALPGGRRW